MDKFENEIIKMLERKARILALLQLNEALESQWCKEITLEWYKELIK